MAVVFLSVSDVEGSGSFCSSSSTCSGLSAIALSLGNGAINKHPTSQVVEKQWQVKIDLLNMFALSIYLSIYLYICSDNVNDVVKPVLQW